MIADINGVLAIALWALVLVAGFIAGHQRGGIPLPMLIMWLAFLSLATVNVLTSASSLVPELRSELDSLRFWAAFFRGTAIVLLVGYVWHRWRD